jgi:hypothetical protein
MKKDCSEKNFFMHFVYPAERTSPCSSVSSPTDRYNKNQAFFLLFSGLHGNAGNPQNC